MTNNIALWFIQDYNAITAFVANANFIVWMAAIAAISVGAAIGWYLSR